MFKHIFKTGDQHILCDCFVPSLRRSLNYDDSSLESILSRRFFQNCFSPIVKPTLMTVPFFQARNRVAGCSRRRHNGESFLRGMRNPIARLR